MLPFPLVACFVSLSLIWTVGECYLRPSETATRQIKLLDGIWNFNLVPEQGLNETREEHTLPKEVSRKSAL